MAIFVQLGATRDGLDPYLHVARQAGMQTVLIETPDYLAWRKILGRQEFDHNIALDRPTQVNAILAALAQLPEPPVLLLAGFERYIYTAYAVAHALNIAPVHPGSLFLPLNKAQQRLALSLHASSLLQPYYQVVEQAEDYKYPSEDAYPLVVKPVDGGGGLGVFLASNQSEVEQALTELQALSNYGGGAFQGVLLESYVPGVEYSVQGIAQDGVASILTLCKKLILTEPAGIHGLLQGFREVGHIALPGTAASSQLQHFVQTAIEAVRYHDGPFHIDFVETTTGLYFLEMGFRLSGGGLVKLVERVSGYSWADEVFHIHLHTPTHTSPLETSARIGQMTALTEEELQTAQQLQEQGHAVEIERFRPPATMLTSPALASDLLRHSGFAGRIIVTAATTEQVEQLLAICSPQRAQRALANYIHI